MPPDLQETPTAPQQPAPSAPPVSDPEEITAIGLGVIFIYALGMASYHAGRWLGRLLWGRP